MKYTQKPVKLAVFLLIILASLGLIWVSQSLAATKATANHALIADIMKLARQGKLPDCSYIAGTTVIDDVEKQWGKPDQEDYVPQASGWYVTYQQRGTVFGYNKGMQIYEIRKNGGKFGQITLSEVKQALGNPAVTRHFNGQEMLGYRAGSKFKLEFVFPAPTKKQANPRLDHVNVLYPQGTVNYMAEYPGRQW